MKKSIVQSVSKEPFEDIYVILCRKRKSSS